MVAIGINTEQTEIRELVAGVKKREIALPEFQRQFVWDADDVARLLASVARGWPIGTFLQLTGEHVKNFQAKQVERAPDIDAALLKTLVLDGQQRLTGIYHAFEGISDYVYYLEIRDVHDNRSFDDENIKAEKANKFPNDLQKQVDAGIIPIQGVVDDQKFSEWINLLPPKRRAEGWFETRNELLPGLRS